MIRFGLPRKRRHRSGYQFHIQTQKRGKRLGILLVIFIAADIGLQHFLQHDRYKNPQAEETELNMNELQYFPLAVSQNDENGLTWAYTDTWNQSRNYGGDRVHEGCDIMTSQNLPGVYPVISISDGVVEKIGWLELGGYRIGIRTDSGTYLYYAHLESYFPGIEEGTDIQAGECLGYVGDTGYGEEGTSGKFAAHLHMGIYLPDKNGEDTAINPYPYLQKLQEHTLTYDYANPNMTDTN